MSDPVPGNAARWHSTSLLYGYAIWIPQLSGMGVFWDDTVGDAEDVVRDAVVIDDASRHDL